MQAGRQKGALPLIRKFNEHSERLLNSALYAHVTPFTLCWQVFVDDRRSYRGEVHPTKRRRLDPGEVRRPVFLLRRTELSKPSNLCRIHTHV